MQLSDAVIHNSPPDIASWPETIRITHVSVRPEGHARAGFALTFEPFEPPARWDYHVPGWGDPARGDRGNILFTVWAVVLRPSGLRHAAGFIQMWGRNPDTGEPMKAATGAPPLSGWTNWAYDQRWGPMANYQPAAGDVFGLFVSAGNARGKDVVTSVRERSNVVEFPLPAGDFGDFAFGDSQAPGIDPPTAPITAGDVIARLARIEALLQRSLVGTYDAGQIRLKPEN